MFEANLLLFIVFNILSRCYCDEKDGNIAGLFYVFEGFHYANKSSVTWGENGQTDFSVSVSMSSSCATYNCSSSCTDTAWEYDLNKLWGKARCGYHHDHHKDSDRFTWRRCSDSSCPAYTEGNPPGIQLAAYSYDDGVAPYTGENPDLLKEFATVIFPDQIYTLRLVMDAAGASTFMLYNSSGQLLEQQVVQHTQLCVDNYNEGTVNGWYFGGSCTAPEDVWVTYS